MLTRAQLFIAFVVCIARVGAAHADNFLISGGAFSNVNHQFGSQVSSSSYFSGDLGECSQINRALTVAPIRCFQTDWLDSRTYSLPHTPTFVLGGQWMADDEVGLTAWLIGPDGVYTSYLVYYTVQPSDVAAVATLNNATITGTTLTFSSASGTVAVGQQVVGSGVTYGTSITGGAGLAWSVNVSQTVGPETMTTENAFQNIVNSLIGNPNDQTGQTTGGCINGTGGYGPTAGMVPATPPHCTGTSAFLLGFENFSDNAPVPGGYRPQAAQDGPGTFVMDAPCCNPKYSTTLQTVYVPYVNGSAHGMISLAQVNIGNALQSLYQPGSANTDAGPIETLSSYNGTRSPAVGDQLGGYEVTTSNTTSSASGAYSYFQRSKTAGLVALASTGSSGTTLNLQAAPVGAPGLLTTWNSGFVAGNWYVVDTTWGCAIPNGTTASSVGGGGMTLTLSANINATTPCPGIASGDLISLVDVSQYEAMVGIGMNSEPTVFLQEGTIFGNGNAPCAYDPGYSNVHVCGNLAVGGQMTTATRSALWSLGPLGVRVGTNQDFVIGPTTSTWTGMTGGTRIAAVPDNAGSITPMEVDGSPIQLVMTPSNTIGIATDGTTTFLTAAAEDFLSLTPLQITATIVSVDGHLAFHSASPTLSTCGTSPSLDATASDTAGTVTEGTSATGCTITFASAFASTPHCIVTSPTGNTLMQYTPATNSLTLVNASATSPKFTYQCFQ